MSLESRRVADQYLAEKTQLQRTWDWFDYKINVGLFSKICGLVRLINLYMKTGQLTFVLPIEFPSFHQSLWNQIFGRNENLY
jgi:hypothetical protein